MFLADSEHRVILGAEVAAVGTSPPQSLAIAGHGGQNDIARQVVPPTDAEVLAYRAHAGMIVRLGIVVLAVIATRVAGHDRVGIVAVVAVRYGADERRAVH